MEHKSGTSSSAAPSSAEHQDKMHYPTPSRLLSSGTKKIFNKSSLFHPQQVYTARLKVAEQRVNPPLQQSPPAATMSSSATTNTSTSSKPGEHFEPRQTATDQDYTPDPAKSLPLTPARQALVDDIIALYSCEPTVERVRRYSPDCVYDDQFVYANDRYKMAGQWFALPKLFNASVNNGYQVIKNERDFIQFKNDQVGIPPPSLNDESS